MVLPASQRAAVALGLVRAGGGQTEHELRAANERLAAALEASEVGVWDWYPGTNVLVASRAGQALLGYEPGEFVESIESYWSRLHADDRERVEAAVRAILHGADGGPSRPLGLHPEEQQDVVHRIVWPGGEVRWLLVKGQLTRDEQGRALRMSGTVIDVTARKRDDWSQRLFAEAEAGMASLDLPSCLRGVARAIASRYADWALVEARRTEGGAALTEAAASRHVSPPTRDAVRALWTRHAGGSSSPRWERPVRFPTDHPADHRLLAQSHAHAALLEYLSPASAMVLPLHVRGEPAGTLTVARTRERSTRFDESDFVTFTELARRISFRLESALLWARLQEREASYRRIVETATEGIVTVGLDGRITFANRSMARLLETTVEELVGRSAFDFFPPADLASAEESFRQRLAGHAIASAEFRVLTATGRTIWARRSSTPFAGPDGRVEGFLSVLTDITEAKRADEERDQNERFRELFIGMLGHDLRNPLSAVLTGTSVLLKRGQLDASDARTLGRIRASGERMSRMIEQLLDFTRSRLGGGIAVATREVDLREIAQHAVDELGAAHPEASIALDAQGATRGTWDPDRLAQLFSNLIHNAVTYGQGTPVLVALRGEGDEVVACVHNGGAAIDPALLPAIFDPFRRADRGAEGKKNGLGLGLYISQQIIAAHGGTIGVRSSAAEGTTFEVKLPRGLRTG